MIIDQPYMPIMITLETQAEADGLQALLCQVRQEKMSIRDDSAAVVTRLLGFFDRNL